MGIGEEGDYSKAMVHTCIAHVMKSMRDALKKKKGKITLTTIHMSYSFIPCSPKKERYNLPMYSFSSLVNSWSLDIFVKVSYLVSDPF